VEKLGDIQQGLVQLSADVHALSHQLHPSILDDLGLADAIKAECASFSQREGVSLTFEQRNVPATLPKAVALCLYRITQESLRNIAKHAHTLEACVSLAGTEDGILLSIRDAGAGFALTEGKGKGGLGLASMEERVRLVQGTFAVRSRPGRGTMIEVRVPLARRQL
jgi:signal transduction histidine kinase